MVVEQLGVDEKDVVPTASFVEDLGADSLDLVELIMSLEEAFTTSDKKVEIPDEAAQITITTAAAAHLALELTFISLAFCRYSSRIPSGTIFNARYTPAGMMIK